MSPVDAERWACAVHEAGHGVVAAALGFTVRRLMLHRPGSPAWADGESARCEIVDKHEEFDRPLDYLAYLHGGSAAERLVFGCTSRRDANDRKQADAFVRVMGLEPFGEMVSLGETLAYARIQDATVASWMRRIAHRLMKQNELTGFEIHECHPRGTR